MQQDQQAKATGRAPGRGATLLAVCMDELRDSFAQFAGCLGGYPSIVCANGQQHCSEFRSLAAVDQLGV